MSANKKHSEPWIDVTDPIYFYNVLVRMIEIDRNAALNKNLSVRFGLMGEHQTPDPDAPTDDHRFGARPNYQVEQDGIPHPTKSIANQPHAHRSADVPRYEEANLSDRRFEFKEIVDLLKTCIERNESR